MKINIFKHDGQQLFDSLLSGNSIIQKVYNTYESIGDKRSDWWFDPIRYKEMSMPKVTPIPRKLNLLFQLCNFPDANYYKLYLYAPNYITILLINVLFRDRKEILIEELCGGDGRLFVFLSKLGFTNFSIVDNFSQLNKSLLEGMILTNNLACIINNDNTEPIVVSHMGYPIYPKSNIPNSVELICQYGNIRAKELLSNLFDNNYIELCRDQNDISVAYCRKDKYEEFLEIIKSYEDIE